MNLTTIEYVILFFKGNHYTSLQSYKHTNKLLLWTKGLGSCPLYNSFYFCCWEGDMDAVYNSVEVLLDYGL